ncbi:hypothetical protein [Arenibaculum pallidiluteum]|uniref:hypothetical protein n=1 Tax=Arenibaculum pallidiluteum TaxID=2812559 RepID=UPI001A97AFEE|nr:hypothetical protein [Arenibaculum pallidiluteum]
MNDGTPIQRPAQTVWEGLDEDERGLFSSLADLLAAEADWTTRRPLFLKIIEKLQTAFERNRRAAGSTLPFMALLPSHMGAILERLDEAEIGSVEQAAFYLLSIHPEHQAAADAWLQADRRRQRDYTEFVRRNPFYGAILGAHDRFHGELDGF